MSSTRSSTTRQNSVTGVLQPNAASPTTSPEKSSRSLNQANEAPPDGTTCSPVEKMHTVDEQGINQLRRQIELAWNIANERLWSEFCQQESHWEGRLSTSALSTATAISAMVQTRESGGVPDAKRVIVDDAITAGCQWLSQHQNNDGGFGDTNRSHSNIATTYLVLAAWELADYSSNVAGQAKAAWEYVDRLGKWDGLRRRYGKDKTFVVPIMMNCALAGLVPWEKIPTLPFEAAWLPQDWYRLAQMPVVSYAIPALVAIGQAQHHFVPSKNPVARCIREWAKQPTLRVLRKMQPTSGGYLEAVPLTSFVLMSLSAAGNGTQPVAQDCLKFILDSRLEDGSWPIDTNLATWVTSLSVNALAQRGGSLAVHNLPANGSANAAGNGSFQPTPSFNSTLAVSSLSSRTVRWLLRCQHKSRHPFTGANPGGWGWTNLSGAVPDADDTPAALLALSKLDLDSAEFIRLRAEILGAVGAGLRWLARLQNRDGGWPTFCKGWGKLPFDRSGTDLTAHALRAFQAWLPLWDEIQNATSGKVPRRQDLETAMQRGLKYLCKQQSTDGSWLPLWFGNQDHATEDNPTYGTGKVLIAYCSMGLADTSEAQRGIAYLREQQNGDGGWGGGESTAYEHSAPHYGKTSTPSSRNPNVRSTIEETAVALEALILCGGDPCGDPSIMRGLNWLASVIQQGNLDCAWPIGFYFAKLWYHERLYPTIFSLSAIGAALGAWPSSSERNQADAGGLKIGE